MKTFNNVIEQLIDVNTRLIENKIDIETAKQVAQNTQVIINAAKVELDVIKHFGGQISIQKCNFFRDVEGLTEVIDIAIKQDCKSEENYSQNYSAKDEEIIPDKFPYPLCSDCAYYAKCLKNCQCDSKCKNYKHE